MKNRDTLDVYNILVWHEIKTATRKRKTKIFDC